MLSKLNLSVLVFLLTLSNSISSRSFRSLQETSRNLTSGDSNETKSTSAISEIQSTQRPITVTQIATPEPNISSTTHYTHPPGFNLTFSSGTENLTVPTDKTQSTATINQVTTTNNSTGHIPQAGSSAPTFPASLAPRTTENHTSQEKTTSNTCSTSHSCSTESSQGNNLVRRCLIAITCMAALSTIFIISTVCLATKLSGYKYKHKEYLLQDTEMVCISALANDTDHPVPKPRLHPKSNGALIPATEDGDPEADNLTLNSFLPETEGSL